MARPNVGRLEQDRRAHESDKLWKVLRTALPQRMENGFKSDTSSDGTDGHYFFIRYTTIFVPETEPARTPPRVVRGHPDHLLGPRLCID
jgi:hypothetical protein